MSFALPLLRRAATPLRAAGAAAVLIGVTSSSIALADASGYRDPSTQTPFPPRLVSPTTGATLVLLGTGVRTVSFLAIKVYAAGFYIDERTLQTVQKGFAPAQLKEQFMDEMLELPRDAAVVIIPQRTTSLPHLRDGFARALVARLKQKHVAATISEADQEESSSAITELKSYFPNRPLAKGAPLFVYLNGSDKSLQFSLLDAADPAKYDVLGTLRNPILAKQLFLSYFQDSGPSSPELFSSTAKGLAGEPRV